MSLVDYASSSDDDEPKPLSEEALANGKNLEAGLRFGVPDAAAPPNNHPPHPRHRTSVHPSSKKMEIVSVNSSELKLPDASLLLNSLDVPFDLLNSSDHSSRVAAAMAENTARKRELNAKPASFPRGKVPKGTLPHLKTVPDAADGRLLPPQLVGRSNVVTEDIGKLFVRKQTS